MNEDLEGHTWGTVGDVIAVHLWMCAPTLHYRTVRMNALETLVRRNVTTGAVGSDETDFSIDFYWLVKKYVHDALLSVNDLSKNDMSECQSHIPDYILE